MAYFWKMQITGPNLYQVWLPRGDLDNDNHNQRNQINMSRVTKSRVQVGSESKKMLSS